MRVSEVQIPTPDLSIYELRGETPIVSMVRTYRDTADRLALQIRKHGATSSRARDTRRNMLAHVSLTKEQAALLHDALGAFLGHSYPGRLVGDCKSPGSCTNTFAFQVRTDNLKQAHDMAEAMRAAGNLYGAACCQDGAVVSGPWPRIPGTTSAPLKHLVNAMTTALKA